MKNTKKDANTPIEAQNIVTETRTPEELLLLKKKKVENEIDLAYKNSIEEFQSCLDFDKTPEILSKYGISLFLTISLFFTYFLGRFRISFTVMIGIIFAVNLFIKRRMNKYKTSFSTLIYRNVMRRKRENNWESVEWMNYVIGKVWSVLEPTISKEILRMVNPILQEKCPPFLSKLKLETFTLGSNPPFVLGITTFDETEPENIVIEAEFGFVPLEMDKESYHFVTRNKKYQWNSKIILVARLGAKLAGTGIDLLVMVKGISFKGRARAIIELTHDKILVKTAEVCFMEMPEIDFTLVPLKTVDLMDVPGLSKWIHTIINTTLKKTAVNPNSIKVDLSKMAEEKTKPIGILSLRVADMKNNASEKLLAEIDVDGRKLYHTAEKEGKHTILNEYFFIMLETCDNNVNFKFLSIGLGNDSFYGEGYIFLKKIIELKAHLESVKVYKNGSLQSTMNCAYKFYPLVNKQQKPKNEHLSNAAIIRMQVLRADDIRGPNAKKNTIHSSRFTVLVSPKIEIAPDEKIEDKKLFKFVTGPVNATALLVGGAFTKAGNVVGNIIPGQSRDEQLLPSSENTFFVYESKTIMETNSPLFNESCEFFCRDVKNDMIYFRLCESGENGKLIGKVDIPVKEIEREKWYRLKDAQNGKIKITFNVEYVNFDDKREFVRFDKAIKINMLGLVSIYEEGSFYCVIKSETDTHYVEPFCVGDLLINKEILIPVSGNTLRIMVFRQLHKEDEYIGEGFIDIAKISELKCKKSINKQNSNKEQNNDKKNDDENKNNDELNDENKNSKQTSVMQNSNTEKDSDIITKSIKNESPTSINKSLLSMLEKQTTNTSATTLKNDSYMTLALVNKQDENGYLQFTAEYSKLNEHNGFGTTHDILKVIQVKFTDFQNINEEFFIEFVCNDEIIQASQISRNYELCDVFLLLCGKGEIRARFKSAKIGHNKILGDCLIPKRLMNERVMLDNDNFSANVEIYTLSCDFQVKEKIHQGNLQLFLRKAKNIKSADSNKLSDIYVKIYLNGTRVHKSTTKKDVVNPVFNESVSLKVDCLVDTIRIEVFDHNKVQQDEFIAYKEFPLYFLQEGLSDIDLLLLNSKTHKKDGSMLNVGFNFTKK
ncbi:Tricalbin-2 [Binucleata daphniae]